MKPGVHILLIFVWSQSVQITLQMAAKNDERTHVDERWKQNYQVLHQSHTMLRPQMSIKVPFATYWRLAYTSIFVYRIVKNRLYEAPVP